MSDVIVGVDLGGTFVKTAAVSRDGRVLSKDSRPTHADEGLDAVLNEMEGGVKKVVQDAGVTTNEVMAVGIGSPGPLNWQTGIVYSSPNLPGWENVPLADLMRERIGVPAFVDNDANVACYGEFWLGAGKDADSIVLLTLGTGVGGGIVVMGQLLRGPDGTAAEVGHLCVMRNGRQCNCGAKGCLEAYASVTGMVRTAIEGLEAGRKTILGEMCEHDYAKLTGKMISDAATQGDAYAMSVMTETAIWIGTGIGSLVNLLNPEKVILAGGMIAAGEMLFRPIRETAKAQSFNVPAARAEIVAAGLGSDSGVIGAAGCALTRYQEGR